MDCEALIHRYYASNPPLEEILLRHSRCVARKALEVAHNHPELCADESFLYEAAMLHDIGIYLCDAPSIYCYGENDYIRHGYLGAELLRKEGLPRHAEVAERHTGTGITMEQIAREHLPLPMRDFCPHTIEEQIICYADKFFSKSHTDRTKTLPQVRRSLEKFGKESVGRFNAWHRRFHAARKGRL